LNMNPEEREAGLDGALDLTALHPGREFEVPPILFKRLEPDDVQRFQEEYGGL